MIIAIIAQLRKWKELNKPLVFLSFIFFLWPACYRSSKTRSQKCRLTFVPACTKPSWLQISIGKISDGPEYKNLASEFAHQLAQKAQLRKPLRKNLRFVGAKRLDKSVKFCVICVCFIALQVGQPEKGVAQNQFESQQFGSEIRQSIAK